MRIIVTGGAGFIGSHLVDRLLEKGHSVLVIDNLSTGLRKFVNPQAEFLQMDIRDSQLKEVFVSFKPDYVFHEAAQTMVPASMEDPALDCDVNVKGLINVLEACRAAKVKKVIAPSSAAVYGNLEELPLDESMTGLPSSFYGITKMVMEHYLRLYQEAFGLPYICFRYANVYGPRQGDGGEGGVISIFGKQAVLGDTFHIFGDGEQTRDFIYVDDVVEANLLAMEKEGVTGIFNVSTNTGLSVNQLVEAFKRVAHQDFTVIYEGERPGDIKHSRLDTSKAEKELGFKARISLGEGLAVTYDYFKEG